MPRLPLIADLRQASAASLAGDALAGSITAVLLIPQALAYALLAGLPPEVGLYASVLPMLAYALLGSSRTLSVGPVAITAVLVAAALSTYAAGDPQKALDGALLLAALSGAVLLLMAVLRLGWLSNFISHPVLSGFSTGAALFIISTQIATLAGITAPSGSTLPQTLQILGAALGGPNPVALAVSLAAIALLWLARSPLQQALVAAGLSRHSAQVLSRTAPLLLVVAATMASYGFEAATRWQLAVVGPVPQGLVGVSLGFLAADGWQALLPAAVIIALINYIEGISVAKALAFKRGEKIDPDQELLALGSTNLVAACAGAMPVSGSFSRSSVNFEAGAKSQFAAVVTALWVALAAVALTGWLAPLPKAVLAAIIVVAVWQLVDFRSLLNTWRYDRGDGSAQALTLIGVLLLGVERGLMLGAGVSLLLFLYRSSRPHIAVLGRIEGSEHYRNVLRHNVTTFPGLLLIRIDETLYFANAPKVESALQQIILSGAQPRHVVIVLSGVNYIDASGLDVLDALERELQNKGVVLHLAEVKGPVMDRLASTALAARLGATRVHLSLEAAVRALAR